MTARIIDPTFDFYPRSPCGERLDGRESSGKFFIFLSTLSLRRATLEVLYADGPTIFLSTLSLRRATLRDCPALSPRRYFYPRSPCGERPSSVNIRLSDWYFYPRSPCGERPSYSQHVTRPSGYFYPRSPCGERPQRKQSSQSQHPISIHALLAESDASCQSP